MIAPIVIIGMHRSGTSMLTRILQKVGLFMGNDKDENDESFFFLNFNEWILKQSNATWDFPEGYKYVDNDIKEILATIYKERSQSFVLANYLGIKKYFKYRKLQNINFAWGWKDPRNSITLDFWKQIYPDMKVLHIYRNPVDVAQSLRLRSLTEKKNFFKKNMNFSAEKFIRLNNDLNYVGSHKVVSLDEGYKLWQIYVKESLTEKKALHIKYENLLSEPEFYLKQIFSYLNLEVSDKCLNQYIRMFDLSKKYAFLNDQELLDFYTNIKHDPLMIELEYHNINNQ